MAEIFPSLNGATYQLPLTARQVLAANMQDASTVEGAALNDTIGSLIADQSDADEARYAQVAAGVLEIAGVPLTPEQIGASNPATQLSYPATILAPTRGSVPSALDHLVGRPTRRFSRGLRMFADFNAGNSTTSPGATLDTGQTITVSGTWGIRSNQAYNVSAGNGNLIRFDTGVTKHCGYVVFSTLPSTAQVQLVARWSDTSNYIAIAVDTLGKLYLSDTVAGVFTARANSANGAYVAGGLLELDCTVDGVATVRVNGAIVLVTYVAPMLTGTSVGVRNAGDTGGAFNVDKLGVSDDQRVSVSTEIPPDWISFDVVALITNLSSTGATGNVLLQYSEQQFALLGGVEAGMSTVGAAVVQAMPVRGNYREVYLGTSRVPPTTRIVTAAVTRVSSDETDTFTDALGLDSIIVRRSA